MKMLLSLMLVGMAIPFITSTSLHFQHNHKRWTQAWQVLAPVAPLPNLSIDLMVILEPSSESSIQSLETLLQQVSSPNSSEYGKYFSKHQLHQEFNLSRNNHLLEFFNSSRLNPATQVSFSYYNDYLYLKSIHLRDIERLFQTTLTQYQHLRTNQTIYRPLEHYTIPETIRQHVVYIDGLEYFPTEFQLQRRQQAQYARDHVDPSKLRQYYHIPSSITATYPNNAIAFTSFLHETYSDKALQAFYNHFLLPVASVPTAADKCRASESLSTSEASLDTQYGIGVSLNEDSRVYCYTNLRDPKQKFSDGNQEPFLQFLIDLNALDDPPAVVSVSYSDDECAVPPEYAKSVNRELIKAGLRGITVVVAAGDNGVYGSELLSYCDVEPCDEYQPMFPSSSPYVLSVGGTQLQLKSKSSHRGKHHNECIDTDCLFDEVVASAMTGALITGGGGFSKLYKRPAYQDKAIGDYLKSANVDRSKFNVHGRGFPDVSALAHGYLVLSHGTSHFVSMDGTSAAAPVVAAIISLVNKHRLENNQPALGFVNPLLYHTAATSPSAFRDIVEGNIACGNDEQGCCGRGFGATVGWDPASGFGSLLYKEWIASLSPTQKHPVLLECQSAKWFLSASFLALGAGVVVNLLLARSRRSSERKELHTSLLAA